MRVQANTVSTECKYVLYNQSMFVKANVNKRRGLNWMSMCYIRFFKKSSLHVSSIINKG